MIRTAKLDHRVFIAFWIFGVLNNVLYVVILSALVDLVGALVPKATVLLADVLPAFILKLVAPFFIHLVPHRVRIVMMVLLDVIGMLIVALVDSVGLKLFAITLVSLSSGGGELTFLQLTHYFNDKALKGFSSGTGGAGLLGSFFYLLFTTWLGISVKTTLLISSLVPFTFFYSFYVILPDSKSLSNNTASYSLVEEQPLNDYSSGFSISTMEISKESWILLKDHISSTLNKLKPLLIPFMLPLFTVYASEYMINQGVSPTLLFDIDSTPFTHYRDMYVVYGTLYQLGVFISRSSSSFVRIRNLYIPSFLQMLNVALFISQSLYMIIPNVWIVMVLVFYEGLLGGASYVNTFTLVSETVPLENREFAMGAVGMSDSAGIVMLASISMWLEPQLCQFQVDSGRPWCRME